MPDRARLADREQEESLRRALPAAGSGPDADGAAAVRALQRGPGAAMGRGGQPAGPGAGARGMSPMTLVAMQRLAGNRATVAALAPRPRTDARLEVSRLHDEEEVIRGGAETGESLAMANEADTAVGTSGGAGSGGGAGAGGGGADDAPPGGAGRHAGEQTGGGTGWTAGQAGARAGEVAGRTAGRGAGLGGANGSSGSRAGALAGGRAGSSAGPAAGSAAGGSGAAGSASATAGAKAGGAAGAAGGVAGAAGGAAGAAGGGSKAAEIASRPGVSAGAVAKATEIAGKKAGVGSMVGSAGAKAGEIAGGAAAGGAAAGSGLKAGEIAGGAAAGGAAAGSGLKAGEIAGGAAAGGAAAGGSRKAPPPPIVAGAAAGAAGGGAAGNAIGIEGGAAGAAIGRRSSGNTIGVAGGSAGGGAAGGVAAGNAIGINAGAAPGPGANVKPAPAVRPGPGGLPAPDAASTGIDWAKVLADYGPPARTVLELTRMVPGWGLLGGLAADSINFASDIAAIPNSQNADLATGLIVFRNVVNIGNNGLGHILYVNQLIQDGLAGSVVGAEFTPLTAAANEALSTTKVVLDEVMMGTDIIVEVESIYQANHAPTSAEADQWRSLADGYAANILGDVVNLVLDVISLASAGAANTAPVQQGRQPLTLAAAFMKSATPNIISAVNGVLGVWLGSLVTEGRQAFVGSPTDLRAQAGVLDAAGLVVEAEGTQARTTYDGINVVIDAMAAYAADQVAQINAVAEALSGGKSAFELIRDAVQSSLDDMARKLDMVQELGAAASDGKANTQSIVEACDAVLGALDAMVLPSVTLPSMDMGDGVVADAAEALASEAAELANAAITEAMSSVSEALDTAKDTIRGPVETAKSQADSLGEWLAILADQCATMAATLGGQISSFSEGLGRCTSVEQVIDLIIGQVSDLTGMPRVTVQEIRDAWNSVGPYIDQFIALGARMHTRATDLRAHADLLESGGAADLAPAPASPSEPPRNPGQGTGTAPVPTTAVA